jgi:WD40 repeat protein
MKKKDRYIAAIFSTLFIFAIYGCNKNSEITEDSQLQLTRIIASRMIDETIITKTEKKISSLTPSLTTTLTSTLKPSSTPNYWLTTPLPIIEKITTENANRVRLLAELEKEFLGKVIYSHNGTFIAAATSKGIYLFASETLAIIGFIYTGEGDNYYGRTFDISPDDTIIAYDSMDGHINLWRISDGALLLTLDNIILYAKDIAFSPDGAISLA